ncbi:hypothetical protein TNCV_4349591 [Trichonephila clavipes]|nr:hypothetical protein TNCV_4349591 [Trichonephila clavipes]
MLQNYTIGATVPVNTNNKFEPLAGTSALPEKDTVAIVGSSAQKRKGNGESRCLLPPSHRPKVRKLTSGSETQQLSA